MQAEELARGYIESSVIPHAHAVRGSWRGCASPCRRGRRETGRRPTPPTPRPPGWGGLHTRDTAHASRGHGSRHTARKGKRNRKNMEMQIPYECCEVLPHNSEPVLLFPHAPQRQHRPHTPPHRSALPHALAPCIPPAAPSALPVSSESTRVLLLKAVSRPDSFSSRLSALQLIRRGSSRCQSPTAPPSLRSSTQEAVELAARRFRRRDVTDLRGPACAQTRSGQRVSFKALGIRRICSACGTSV